jgi:hypothetical protein
MRIQSFKFNPIVVAQDLSARIIILRADAPAGNFSFSKVKGINIVDTTIFTARAGNFTELSSSDTFLSVLLSNGTQDYYLSKGYNKLPDVDLSQIVVRFVYTYKIFAAATPITSVDIENAFITGFVEYVD